MVRSFTDEPVAPTMVERMLDTARRGPSAGFTQSLEFLVLEGSDQTRAYWDVALPVEARDSFPWPRLLDAPVLVIPVVGAGDYVERYRQPDKSSTALGGSPSDWPVPYWHVDAGAAVMLLLLAATDEGLGALFFGQFDHEAEVAARFAIPHDRQAVGTIAIGHPDGQDRPSRSVTDRPRRPLEEIVHRARW